MQQGQLKCVIDCTTKHVHVYDMYMYSTCAVYITSDSLGTVFDDGIDTSSSRLKASNCSAIFFFSFSIVATYMDIHTCTRTLYIQVEH